VSLRQLNLQNCRMGDKFSIALLDVVLMNSKIQDLNIAQNNLGFKTGSHLLNFLKSCHNLQNANRLFLTKIQLEFNLMSESVIKRIQE
jgi:hypothetical protein